MKYICEVLHGDYNADDGIYSAVVRKSFYNKNSRKHPFNMNNSNLIHRLLSEQLSVENIEIHTYGYFVDNNMTPDLIIFHDIPKKNKIISQWRDVKKFLILHECEVIKPKNWDLGYHKYFDKIFTWHTDYLHKEKYVHLPSINIRFDENEIDVNLNLETKKYFCVLISSNKFSMHKLELFSERLKLIKWFAKYHPSEFDLYGFGWDKLKVRGGGILFKILNRLMLPNIYFNKYSHVYKGVVDNKIQVLKKYKFNIVYENAIDIPGYITEKIFHSFLSGTVPVYLGPSKKDIPIPSGCYIDRRDFNDDRSLYLYLKSMSKETYFEMQKNIAQYLKSNFAKKYSVQSQTKILFDEIMASLKSVN
jgi:hypothetical protein